MWIKTPEGRMINMSHVCAFNKCNDVKYDSDLNPIRSAYTISFIMDDGCNVYRHFYTDNEKKRDANYEKLCDIMERSN